MKRASVAGELLVLHELRRLDVAAYRRIRDQILAAGKAVQQ